MNDNYHGFEGATPTGSRVTIDFDLAMVPAASSLSSNVGHRKAADSVKNAGRAGGTSSGLMITDGGHMRRLIAVAVTCLICCLAAMAHAQQIDVAFAGGSLASPGNSFSGGTFLPAEGGGAFVGFNGDVLFKPLFKGSLGVQAEVNWKGSQVLYGGQLPYRPLFYDFNAMYARRFNKYLAAEALAGIGGESIRFYSNSYDNCDFYGNCTNYMSSNHFMGDFGGGVRFYPYGNFFVRPEMRLYLINNNEEFRSSHVVRYGVSIGYAFGGSK